jgi:hypothetical protein
MGERGLYVFHMCSQELVSVLYLIFFFPQLRWFWPQWLKTHFLNWDTCIEDCSPKTTYFPDLVSILQSPGEGPSDFTGREFALSQTFEMAHLLETWASSVMMVIYVFKICPSCQAVLAHTLNPAARRKKQWISVSSRPAWSEEKGTGHPGLHRETPCQKNKNKNKNCLSWYTLIDCKFPEYRNHAHILLMGQHCIFKAYMLDR